jgi:DNA-binding HxlR family transcriptional regulator
MDQKFRSQCPISSALDLIGDKWSLLIIRDMMFSGKRTFSEFSASQEKIATNILSDRLTTLENAGIIRKSKMPDNKKTNIYTLTNKGINFLPVLAEIILWSNENLNDHLSEQTRDLARKIKNNKTGFIGMMNEKLTKTSNEENQ